VVEVAPLTLLNVAPPSVLTCHCTVGVGVPVAAAVKLVVAPTVSVSLVGFPVIAGGTFTVTVVDAVTAVPAALVTVNVYVVVVAGETVLATPLTTVPTPLSTEPPPLLKTAVSVVEPPTGMVAAPGVKLEIAGSGTTVTVVVVVTVVPAALVTVNV
jgi:hypothetical protein